MTSCSVAVGYQRTQRHNPEDLDLNLLRHENYKSLNKAMKE